MLIKKSLFLFFLVAIAFTACQKEIDDSIDDNNGNGVNNGNGSTGTSITGTWNFTQLNTQTQSTAEINLSGIDDKTVSLSDYITTDNAGSFLIDDSVIHINGLTYTVSSVVKAYTYENGVLVDSADSPFDFTLPSTNSSGKYKLIGADSIYFPEGSIISLSGSTTQSEPAGGKLNLSGNKLIITQHIYQDTVENVSGVDYHMIETGTAAISLQKQ